MIKKGLIIFMLIILVVFATTSPFYYRNFVEKNLYYSDYFSHKSVALVFLNLPFWILIIYPIIYFSVVIYKYSVDLKKSEKPKKTFKFFLKVLLFGFITTIIYEIYPALSLIGEIIKDGKMYGETGWAQAIIMIFLALIGFLSFLIYGLVSLITVFIYNRKNNKN